jgi:hypothetical protein
LRVEFEAGYRGQQEPLAFWLGQRRLAVRAVVDRWFAPTQRWFKVDADDGSDNIRRTQGRTRPPSSARHVVTHKSASCALAVLRHPILAELIGVPSQ